LALGPLCFVLCQQLQFVVDVVALGATTFDRSQRERTNFAHVAIKSRMQFTILIFGEVADILTVTTFLCENDAKTAVATMNVAAPGALTF